MRGKLIYLLQHVPYIVLGRVGELFDAGPVRARYVDISIIFLDVLQHVRRRGIKTGIGIAGHNLPSPENTHFSFDEWAVHTAVTKYKVKEFGLY